MKDNEEVDKIFLSIALNCRLITPHSALANVNILIEESSIEKSSGSR